MFKSISAFLLTLSAMSAFAQCPLAGSGTSESPFLVSTYEDLKMVGYGACALGADYRQTADIDARASASENPETTRDGLSIVKGFSPIGAGSDFTGNYHGGGHIIRGLYMNQFEPSALFYKVSGSVDSLGLIDGLNDGAFSPNSSMVYELNGRLSHSYSANWFTEFGEDYLGNLVLNNEGGTIENCYAMGNAYGGSLVATNNGSIINSYALGDPQDYDYQIGLVASASPSGTVTQSYWDIEMTGQSAGAQGVGLTSLQMRTKSTFFEQGNPNRNWDFSDESGHWAIYDGKSYPFLKGMLNPAFAVNDIIEINTATTLDTVLSNDIDPATGTSANLAYKLVSHLGSLGNISNGSISFADSTPVNYMDSILYRVGLIKSAGDTLWSNLAKAVFINSNENGFTFSLGSDSVHTLGDAPFTTNAIYTKGNQVLSLSSSDPTIATVNGLVVTMHAIGSTVLTATTELGTIRQQLTVEPVSQKPTGAGTDGNPYVIANLANLVWLAKSDSAWSKTFSQTATSIDLSSLAKWNNGKGWMPIGNYDKGSFSGKYRGNGNSIRNISIQSTDENQGFFGRLTGSVDGLTLQGGMISTGSNSGALVGYLNGEVTNCHSNVTVVGSNYSSAIGGLVGQSGTNSYIANSSARGDVSGGSYGQVGGFFGLSNGAISLSYSTGRVTSLGNKAGGFVGEVGGSHTINTSYATGDVKGINYIGGFAGNINGNYTLLYIQNSYATGNATGIRKVGGFVGYRSGYVSEVYAAGKVTGMAEYGPFQGSQYRNESPIQSYYSGTGFSSYGTLLSLTQMRQENSFYVFGNNSKTWDFTSGSGKWEIRNGSTYPYLQNMVNAPFTLPDSIDISSPTIPFSNLLSNDIDPEAGSNTYLVWKIISSFSGKASLSPTGEISFPATALYQVMDSLDYQTGIVIGNDTLWGNVATAKVKNMNDNGFHFSLGADSVHNVGDPSFIANAEYTRGNGVVTLTSDNPAVASVVGKTVSLNAPGKVYLTAESELGRITKTLYVNPEARNPVGSGTAQDPYQIANVGNYIWLQANSSAWNKHLVQTADIDFQGSIDWLLNPIGTESTPFTGVYKGKGHIIRNLNIYQPNTDQVGLFGRVASPGSIDSLGMMGGTVTGKSSVGALVGVLLSGSSVQHSFATTTVSITGEGKAGGLVGYTVGTIRNSYATGTVDLGYIGSGGALSGFVSGTLEKCFATGQIVLSTINFSGEIGGLVGAALTPTVTQSYWDSQATGRNYSPVGQGYNTQTMKTKGLYFVEDRPETSWDFENTWAMYPGYTYPMLRAFLTPVTLEYDFAMTYTGKVPVFDSLTMTGFNQTPSGKLDSTKLMISQNATTLAGAGASATDAGTYATTLNLPFYSTVDGYWITSIPGSLEITPAPLTLTGVAADSKQYDGTTAAAISGSLAGLVNGETATLVPATGTFDSPNVGDNIAVTITPFEFDFDGTAKAQNYTLPAQPSGLTANITAAPLSITGVTANDKTYDGTAATTLTAGSLVGLVTGQTATLVQGTGSFADADVGTDKTVTVSGFGVTFNGTALASNYTAVSQPTGLRADITKAPLSITIANDTIYMGAADPTTKISYNGFVNGEDSSVLENVQILREEGTTAGDYDLSISATATNYEITVVGGTLTILSGPVNVQSPLEGNYTGMAMASVRDLNGRIVWSGSLVVVNGRYTLPKLGEGRFVVNLKPVQ